MNMEKYSKVVDSFAAANCHVKEEDIMKHLKGNRKRSWRAIAGIAACVAFIFVVGTTVSAATGLLDMSALFKKLFSNDETTSKLIDEGAVQEINHTFENDNYELTFQGITGDSNTQFGVFKLVDKNGELGEPTLVQIDVKMVGMSVIEEGRLHEFGSLLNEDCIASDEEENAYYIKVHLPSHWIYYSHEDIYVLVEKIRAYYGNVEFLRNSKAVIKADKSLEIDLNQNWTFTPDRSILPESVEFAINEAFTTEYGEFTVTKLDVSNYQSEIIITFPTNESIQDVHDATAVWHRFDNDIVYEPLPDMEIEGEWPVFKGDLEVHAFYEGRVTNFLEAEKRYVKTVKDPSIYNDGDVKLFVNGVELKRKMNNSYRWASAMDSEDNPTLWGNLIVFDPIDLLEAETIEIRYKDQVIKVK